MRVQVEVHGELFEAVGSGHAVGMPLHFDGPQPRLYGVPSAKSYPYEGQGFVGDVRRGGGVNFETQRLTPHCNGTHTECVGHISRERVRITDHPPAPLLPATLISVAPEPAEQTSDTYDPALATGDWVISRFALEAAWRSAHRPGFDTAVMVRTLPNPEGKPFRDYGTTPAAFFSLEAMAYLADNARLLHVLVDLPSVDRLRDEGKLRNHRQWWELPPGSQSPAEGTARTRQRTITEFCFFPRGLPDGSYLLNLQIAAFALDAAPSRPVVWPISPVS